MRRHFRDEKAVALADRGRDRRQILGRESALQHAADRARFADEKRPYGRRAPWIETRTFGRVARVVEHGRRRLPRGDVARVVYNVGPRESTFAQGQELVGEILSRTAPFLAVVAWRDVLADVSQRFEFIKEEAPGGWQRAVVDVPLPLREEQIL
jgi:hypothetical protein